MQTNALTEYSSLKRIGKKHDRATSYVGLTRAGEKVFIRVQSKGTWASKSSRTLFRYLQESPHPNLMQLLDVKETKTQSCLIFEYLEGPKLRTLLLESKAFLFENQYTILHQLATAIYTLHKWSYIHTDIKPENIIITDGLRIVLTDYEFCQTNQATWKKKRRITGTPSYLAPESFKQHTFSEQSDIYSFGVTAFELCTGRKPYLAESPAQYLNKQLDRSSGPKITSEDLISQKLEFILTKCLAKRKGDRYLSMRSVLNDLESNYERHLSQT